jgi:hypothetical protein
MNCKMARPHLTLDKWLSTDTDLKRFLGSRELHEGKSIN